MLPRLVERLLRIVVPRQRVDGVLADLQDDYDRHRSRRWLATESLSLALFYLGARLRKVMRMMPLLARDCQMVLRSVRGSAAPAIAAAALLGVAISAVLVTGGLTHTLLFQRVSPAHGDALRRVAAADLQGRTSLRFSLPEVNTIRDHVAGTAELTTVYLQPVALRANGTDVHTMAEVVDGRYFGITGTSARVGRVLMPPDDRPNAPPVVVLAEPFWRRQFGGRLDVVGRDVSLNGAAFTVIGVAATIGSRSSLGASVDSWVPIAHADPILDAGWRTEITDRWFTVFALPTPPANAVAVESRLAAATADLQRGYPEAWRERRLHTTDATVLAGSQRSAATMLALVLGGLTVLIVFAAASNASGVLIARAAASSRATAIHLAVGAGRAVVIRRQLIEGASIGGLAGLLAVALYQWVRRELAEVALLPTLSLRLDLPLDIQIGAMSLGVGAFVGTVLAIAPALWSSQANIVDALRHADGRVSGGSLAARTRRRLVSTQVGLSLVLVVGAALFLRSLDVLASTDLGFARHGLVAMDFDVEPRAQTPAQLNALGREVLTRIAALPAIAGTAMSNRAPVDGSTPTVEVREPGDDTARFSDVTMYLTTEGYFDAVGVTFIAGRPFTMTEANDAASVVIVNESLAGRLWGTSHALDRTLLVSGEHQPLRVVGVARDSKYRTLTEERPPHIYRPTPPALGLTLLARTRGEPRAAMAAIQRELDHIRPGLVGFFPRTMEDHLAVQLLPTRAAANAATILATLALLLSGVALYALVTWLVVLRRREIGVRVALGATRWDVHRLVVRHALSAAAPGMVMGLLLAIALGVVARSALFGVAPVDPIAIGVALAVVLIVVLAAGYLPGRAAASVDPVQALRQ
jgi:predicted permease